MGGALEGLLVVALEQAVAAPFCTRQLADAGARVIKIERAGGETARHYDRVVHGTSSYFAWLNRGKQSTVLDVKDAGDRALIERMLARADVLVQNLAPGAAARLGLSAAQACARHPRLVAVDIAGYGADTPARDMRAYDMLVQAESGLCSVTGGAEAPARVGISIADITTGMAAHALVLEALVARGITGRGRAVEVAMFDVLADLMAVPLLHHDCAGRATPRTGLRHASIYPYGAFDCADGAIMVAVQSPAEWGRFCAGVLQMPALAGEARFIDTTARVANRVALDAVMAPVFAGHSRAEMVARCEAHQIAWARLSSLTDLSGHAALRRMDGAVAGGAFQAPRPAGRAALVPGPVPELGADTAAIRAEFA